MHASQSSISSVVESLASGPSVDVSGALWAGSAEGGGPWRPAASLPPIHGIVRQPPLPSALVALLIRIRISVLSGVRDLLLYLVPVVPIPSSNGMVGEIALWSGVCVRLKASNNWASFSWASSNFFKRSTPVSCTRSLTYSSRFLAACSSFESSMKMKHPSALLHFPCLFLYVGMSFFHTKCTPPPSAQT